VTESESGSGSECGSGTESDPGSPGYFKLENRKKRKAEQMEGNPENNPRSTKQRKCQDNFRESAENPNKRDTRRNSFVEILFQGKEQSTIQCLNCQHTSSNLEPFLDISLSIKEGQSLEYSLDQYVALERLEDQNKYQCTRCNTMTDAQRHLKFSCLPPILMVHLKRTENEQGKSSKVSFPVECPKILKFGQYITDDCPQENMTYELFAMILHKGANYYSGPYVTLVNLTQDTIDQIRKPNSENSDNEEYDSDLSFLPEAGSTWLSFDDEQVAYVTESEAMDWLKKTGRKKKSQQKTAEIAAYILFYRLQSH